MLMLSQNLATLADTVILQRHGYHTRSDVKGWQDSCGHPRSCVPPHSTQLSAGSGEVRFHTPLGVASPARPVQPLVFWRFGGIALVVARTYLFKQKKTSQEQIESEQEQYRHQPLPERVCLAPQPPAGCLNILMVATEPRPKLRLMQPCALISCRKNLFTMRPQENIVPRRLDRREAISYGPAQM